MKIFLAILFISTTLYSQTESREVTDDADLDSLIFQCDQLEADPQIKPFKTHMLCSGKKTYWELQSASQFNLSTTYTVDNSATMKDGSFVLPNASFPLTSPPNVKSCNMYQEMQAEIVSTTTVMNSCQELKDVREVGRDQFCANALAEVSPEEGVPTGNTYSTCPDVAPATGEEPLIANFHGAKLAMGEIEVNDTKYFSPKILTIADPCGVISLCSLKPGDYVIWVKGEQMTSLSRLNEKLHSLKGTGPFRIIAIEENTSTYKAIDTAISAKQTCDK